MKLNPKVAVSITILYVCLIFISTECTLKKLYRSGQPLQTSEFVANAVAATTEAVTGTKLVQASKPQNERTVKLSDHFQR